MPAACETYCGKRSTTSEQTKCSQIAGMPLRLRLVKFCGPSRRRCKSPAPPVAASQKTSSISRKSKMTISPWHHHPRIRLTPQKVAKLFLERHGCCRECGRKLGPSDDYIVEHIIALENGGTNDWDNLGITCLWCKPKKDAEDHATAASTRSKATKHFISKSMRQSKWPSRKFSKREPIE